MKCQLVMSVVERNEKFLNRIYRSVIKRLIDIILSLLGIVVLSPIMLIIAIAIRIDDKGTILFRQERVGKHKETFEIWKFRTMLMSAPKDTPTHLFKTPAKYITRVGRILRKSSLDELPQLFQILSGRMTIVGPRPALWNQDDLVAERDKHTYLNETVNDLTPGLTGWAQINGRDELPIDVKAKLDGEYLKRLSFLFDIRCFFGTFISVLKGRGILEGGTDADQENSANTYDGSKP